MQQRFLDIIRNKRGKSSLLIDNIENYWNAMQKSQVESMLSCAFIGYPATVKEKLQYFINRTQADELIVSADIFDQSAKLHSYELLADIGKQLVHA